jgi:DNA invertase Pin-like site-specific DNA recombinase
MPAYGYIRKSVVHDPTRLLSAEMQEAAIRKLAAADRHEDIVILSDLDVSGRKRRTSRPGWDELLSAVEAGEATAVYAYSLSRFARSVAQLAEFFELCERHHVRVRVDRDQIDTSTATGKLVGNVLASLAQFEADVASERVKDAFAAKRIRDPEWVGPGQKPYGSRDGEDPMIVVAAFRDAGSFDGAARRLNVRGIPCRVEGAAWSGSVVREIVRRHAPDEVGPSVRRGAPAGRRWFRLSQLITCSACGKPLTGSRDTRRGDVRYACPRARTVPHARGWVNESKLLPLVAAEARQAALLTKRLQRGSAEDELAMRELEAERQRVKAMFRKGRMDEPEFDAAMAEIDDDVSKLSTRRWVRRLSRPLVVMDTVDDEGTIVPADDAGKVNAYLRRLFERVTVDMSQPARRGPSSWVPSLTFQWRDPSMRAPGDA